MDGPARHALIIEDEIVVGLSMQGILADMGFATFAFASTVDQALEQGRLRKPDLVTSDISLLDGDGWEACQALEAELGPLLIIYVTGQHAPPVHRPNHGLVAKPFTAADISSTYQALQAPPAA